MCGTRNMFGQEIEPCDGGTRNLFVLVGHILAQRREPTFISINRNKTYSDESKGITPGWQLGTQWLLGDFQMPYYIAAHSQTPSSDGVQSFDQQFKQLCLIGLSFGLRLDRVYTEKTIFPFTLNGIWSWWQFFCRFWTKWKSIWIKIDRKTVTTIVSHSMWKEMEI